jgi:superkiller protein 3
MKFALHFWIGILAVVGIFTAGCDGLGVQSKSLANDTTISLEAREWSKKIDQSPDIAEYYIQRAAVLNNEKRYDLAILDFQQAIKLEPDNSASYYKLGDAYFAADQTTNALEQYKLAENTNPNDVEAVFKHAQFLYFVRQFDKGKIKFGKLLNLDTEHAEGHFYNAMLHKEDGDTAQAIYFFRKTIELLGADYNSSMQLGSIYETLNEVDKSIQFYQQAINTDPKSDEAYYAIGLAYQKRGDKSLAKKNYQKAIDLNSQHFLAYYNAGNMLASEGDYTSAIDHFEICLRLKEDFAKAYNRIGQCFELLKVNDKAIENYLKCLEIDPNFALAKEGLVRLGKIESAN